MIQTESVFHLYSTIALKTFNSSLLSWLKLSLFANLSNLRGDYYL